ncbi:transposase [Leisingera sp. M658]|uniref:IS66 family transposase n=1 Tax=Leisingera sp. M658 TaxID=2867015 RepID=UPI0021A769C3|nr:transposase [Leisingera sp. M658]
MAHIWRKFVDVFQSQGLAVAEEAIRRIAELYAVEKDARGLPPQDRAQLRQTLPKPLLDELEAWLAAQLARIPGCGSAGRRLDPDFVREVGLRRIAEFYRIEGEIRGRGSGQRLPARQDRTAPLAAGL